MKRALFFIVFASCLIMSYGCEEKEIDYTVENVTRIFMHERGKYTFYSEDPNSSELIIRTEGFMTKERIFKDVPEGKKMWYRYHVYQKDNRKYYELEIHVHSEKDIDGAGWNHGKFGSGQTNVIE